MTEIEFFSPKTLAERWSRTRQHIYDLIAKGDLEAVPWGKQAWDVSVHRSEVERYEKTTLLGDAESARNDAVVYFIDCGEYTKIGMSHEIRDRMKQIEAANPLPLLLWGTIRGGWRMEQHLHDKFNSFRHRYEWFAFDEDMKRSIRAWLLENGGEIFGDG